MTLMPFAPAAATLIGLQPTGDVTGTRDTLAINNAVAALPAAGGTVTLGGGTWYVKGGQVVIGRSAVYLQGAGKWATYVRGVGSGAVFRMFDPANFDTRTVNGGGVGGLAIDTSAMTGSSSAIHWGDLIQSRWDVACLNFTPGNTCIGWWADNQWGIGEQSTGLVYCAGNAVNVQWDQNPAGGSTMCSGSFERPDMTFYVNQLGAANIGFLWNNGTFITGAACSWLGNFGGSASVLTSSVFRAQGSTPAGSADGPPGSKVSNAQWFGNVNVECQSGSAHNPTTFSVDGGGAFFGPIFGNLNFGAAGANFAPTSAIVSFFGLTDGGDPNIVAQTSQAWLWQGQTAIGTYAATTPVANGATLSTAASYLAVSSAGAVTGLIITLGGFDGQKLTVVNTTAFTLTFAAAATSHVADGVSDVIPALTAREFTYSINTSLWYRSA